MLFLVSIVKGYVHIRRFEIAQHREWMIRAFAIGLGISTFRVLLPILMSPLFGASFPEAWDTVVWLGFAVNIVVAEVWINITRPQARRAPVSERAVATGAPAGGIAPAVSVPIEI